MNAKEEFIEHARYIDSKIICAIVRKMVYDDYGDGIEEYCEHIALRKGYTEEDYKIFLEKLDFNYNPYQCEELQVDGCIWYDEGYSDRYVLPIDYDPCEMGEVWINHITPDIDPLCL